MHEQALALKAIWTQDEAEYHGELVSFDPLYMWPKPASKPHTPVPVGGKGPTVLDRVLDYGDGWIPNDHPELPERAAELRDRAEREGREAPPVTAFAVEPDAARVRLLARAGIARCVFNLPTAGAGEVIPALKRLARLASQATD